MNTTQAAITLERILTDPRGRAAIHALQNAMPTHRRDQAHAGCRNLHALALEVGRRIGATETLQDFGDTPEWLRLEILTRIAAHIDGTADTCRHSPSPDQLTPVFAAACKPNVITCGHCTHLLSMPQGGVADRTCDACGHVCAGLDEGEGIYPGLSRYGLLVFMYGVCGSCRPPRRP